jgi:regulator of sigma E protease
MAPFVENFTLILIAILGLAFLMVVHETGHFLLARYFGMRVQTFSIGFGPALYRRQPKGSPTTYQIAIIPFLAYVQIAGMNPLDEIDPNDKQSYANAPLRARILTIFGGPLANYLVASVLYFVALQLGGRPVLTTTILTVFPGQPAEAAQMKSGDKILEMAGEPTKDWEQVRRQIGLHSGRPLEVVVERGGNRVPITVVPVPAGKDGARIGIEAQTIRVPISTSTAAVAAIVAPPKIVAGVVVGLVRIAMGWEKPELAGPLGIGKELVRAARRGAHDYLEFLGALSAYLAGFNLLPVPALDGGRLMFLGYELIMRKRPNARVEASVHAVGLIMLLTLVAAVTVFSDMSRRAP